MVGRLQLFSRGWRHRESFSSKRFTSVNHGTIACAAAGVLALHGIGASPEKNSFWFVSDRFYDGKMLALGTRSGAEVL
jgi:hypothetical protein